MIQQLQKLKKNVLLQWIPAHCGIIGNETADLLAKKSSELSQRTNTKLTIHICKKNHKK